MSDWVAIEGFPGYTINRDGQIKGLKGTILKPGNNAGYRQVVMVDNNKKHNDMLLIYVIITYLENILNALNKDIQKESDKYRYISNLQNNQYELQLLCKLILQSLMELPNMITNQDLANISYKNDVEYMRELDKQKKFEFKDNMSDDERLLYINYEKNGLADKIDSEDFHKRMYTTEEMYSDIQNASNNNPEYTAILGEDDDNDEY